MLAVCFIVQYQKNKYLFSVKQKHNKVKKNSLIVYDFTYSKIIPEKHHKTEKTANP
jgi:hypothetical protein